MEDALEVGLLGASYFAWGAWWYPDSYHFIRATFHHFIGALGYFGKHAMGDMFFLVSMQWETCSYSRDCVHASYIGCSSKRSRDGARIVAVIGIWFFTSGKHGTRRDIFEVQDPAPVDHARRRLPDEKHGPRSDPHSTCLTVVRASLTFGRTDPG